MFISDPLGRNCDTPDFVDNMLVNDILNDSFGHYIDLIHHAVMNDEHFDTIIVGGGAAGIGAAIGAKQAAPESRVLIVESEGCLGGAATHRGVLSFCGLYSAEKAPRRVVGEIWTEIHSRLVKEQAASKDPDNIVAYVQAR